MAERLPGPTPEWWFDQPAALAFYAYRHLQERDRADAYIRRLEHIELARLFGLAMSNPGELKRERDRALAEAAGRRVVRSDEEILANARRMAEGLEQDRATFDQPVQLVS